MNEVYEFLSKGGLLMIPILGASVIGLGFFLERLWALQRTRVIPQRFIEVVRNMLREKRFHEAENLCQTNESPIAAILEAGIQHAGCERSVVKEVMLEKGERELFFLERFVNALGAIATISPLMGLLGTVIGMIDVFQRVVNQAGAGGAVDPGAMANGIWTALITTAAGLTVAIPVYLAYRYIMGRIDRYAVDLEDVALEMAEYLVPESEAAAAYRKRAEEQNVVSADKSSDDGGRQSDGDEEAG
ncbi:MAG: MotA/TolQ/ExbB proton channel family protein [Myxococcota bacterium]